MTHDYTFRSELFAFNYFRPTKLRLTGWRLAVFLVIASAFSSRADVRLPALFTDHAVLQQKARVPIWGWADEGERVTVELGNQRVVTVARGGKWSASLYNLKAGGPFELKISGKNTITLRDVLVGEVWAASGQSNMEWPLRLSHEPQADMAASANSMIRLFTVPKLKADEPRSDVKSSWQLCGPDTVTNFSAVAYYFGRDLQKARGVPVGIIHTSWGGSPAEVWMSHDVLAANPGYKKSILESYDNSMNGYQTALAKFQDEQAELKSQGKTSDKKPPGKPYWKPSELYNGMIAPVLPFAIKGAIWYQGESNAGRAHQYRSLFADMIRNWRRDWRGGDFTFLAVQLAPWDKNKKRSLEEISATPGDSDWAELREAQVVATRVLPKVGLAVITDVGDKDDIHPTKKGPVGARLALAARKIAYGENIVASGPAYQSMSISGDKVILNFNSVGSGLEARGGELKGFAVAGADQKFVWAHAEIQGRTVVVTSPQVPKPVAVRYGWADYPVVNLWNQDGLPASPFRTDDFPMITKPKN